MASKTFGPQDETETHVYCITKYSLPFNYVKQSDVCMKGYYGYSPQGECPSRVTSGAIIPDASKDAEARIATLEKENQRLTDELNAIQRGTIAP